ncbi:DUF6944 family repetitive protein [Pseudalkalibacillus hwajinpoensis]|uniref:Uncharacterized protein n=1 Tax=Guptibacillus hwajinpoensis TaxID=208199 RepID=A0A4U1MLN3_9BACL|nr:hypothetical protein [Pseudalkalibacillus hwajinpoensis]TKD71360.1 hypothetical protein FBF83_00675 [Pseudalkalibacillus hwajinpoensis]
MDVNGEQLIITGAWIQTIGAGVASIGNTLIATENEDSENVGGELYVLGNAIEATGNAIKAIGRTNNLTKNNEDETLGTMGAWFQAAGNLTNVIGGSEALTGKKEEGLKIDILGDVVQSTGAAFEATISSISDSAYAGLITTGQRIQSFAVAIEAIGLLYIKRGKVKLGQQIVAIGSYGQTAGAALAAIGFTKRFNIKE